MGVLYTETLLLFELGVITIAPLFGCDMTSVEEGILIDRPFDVAATFSMLKPPPVEGTYRRSKLAERLCFNALIPSFLPYRLVRLEVSLGGTTPHLRLFFLRMLYGYLISFYLTFKSAGRLTIYIFGRFAAKFVASRVLD